MTKAKQITIRTNSTTAPILKELTDMGLGTSDIFNSLLLFYKSNKTEVSEFLIRRLLDKNQDKEAIISKLKSN